MFQQSNIAISEIRVDSYLPQQVETSTENKDSFIHQESKTLLKVSQTDQTGQVTFTV